MANSLKKIISEINKKTQPKRKKSSEKITYSHWKKIVIYLLIIAWSGALFVFKI